MPRLSITAGLITSLALAAGAQVSSVPAFPDGTLRGGRLDAGEFTRVQECRMAATAATTRTKGPGLLRRDDNGMSVRQGDEQVDLHQQVR